MLIRSMTCMLAVVLSASAAMCDDAKCPISDITWTLGPNLPEFRKGGCATALGGKVVSVFGMRQPWGEMDTMYVYDPATDWWQREPHGPIGQTYVQGTEWEDAFYSIGGRSRDKGGVHTACFRLRFVDGKWQWQPMADLNEARGWAPSVAVDGKLYVFGGSQDGHGPTLNSVEMLDTSARQPAWKTIAEIPGLSRGWCGAAAAGGKIYVLGGSYMVTQKETGRVDRKRLNEVWQFDPETRHWEAKRPLPYRLSGFDCAVYCDRYIVVVGGCAETDDFTPEMRKIQQQDRFYKSYYCPFTLVYDTTADRWHRMASTLPMPTNDIRVVLLGGKLYALGGENIEPATSNTTPWLRIGSIQRASP
ncbi:MAG: Kelch repeat-containing protein [Pirellulales bacterium]